MSQRYRGDCVKILEGMRNEIRALMEEPLGDGGDGLERRLSWGERWAGQVGRNEVLWVG